MTGRRGSGAAAEVRRLHRSRPRQRFVTASVAALLVLVAISWTVGDFGIGDVSTDRKQANARRFVGELQPWPLQQDEAPEGLAARWRVGATWFGDMWREKGGEAVATTLAISLVAILLAGTAGAAASLPAARNFATSQPFLADGRRPTPRRCRLWQAVVGVTRLVLTVLRALPEYIWAFLLLALFGPTVWPMILALALHNTGILGKLSAEVIENVDTRAPAALRGAGAGRLAIALAALVPLSLPRFLLFFFYRWETCVRESTVLGMLGMASLGFWIVDARARNTYDQMFFYIVCGMLLVVAGEVVSGLVRHLVRRA